MSEARSAALRGTRRADMPGGQDPFARETALFRLAAAPPGPQAAAPQGANRTINVTEDVLYVFSQSDFGFSDSDGHGFAGIFLTTAPANGAVGVGGGAIGAGSFVSAATIAAGEFFFEAGLNANGTNFTSFTFQVRDSSGAQDASPNTITVNVIPVNDPPRYINLNSGSAGTFNEGQTTPQRLDFMGNGEVEDIDSLDFDGGFLRVSIVQGGTPAEDRLGIGTIGTVTISGTAIGSSVSVGGIVIGTIAAGGTGISEDLVVSFNASANADRVELLVRALTYFNVSDNPSAASRTVRLSLNDGDGPQIGSTDVTVHIMGFNDAPILSAPTTSQINYLPGNPLTPLWAGVTMTDPDNQAHFIGGNIQMSVGGSSAVVELIGARFTRNGFGFLTDTTTGLQVGELSLINGNATVSNLTSAATAEVVNALIQAFGFRTQGENPTLGSFQASLTFFDGTLMFGGGLTSNMVHQTVTVGTGGSAPVVDLNGAGPGVDAMVLYTEGGTPVRLAMGTPIVLDANGGDQLDKMTLSLSSPEATDILTWGGLPAGVTVTVVEEAFRRLITFTGGASPQAYQGLLDSIRYASTDDTPASQRSIEIRVESSGVPSAVARADINILAVDDPGVAHDDLLVAGKSEPFYGNVGFDNGFGMDEDPDGFTVTAVNGAAGNVGQILTFASGATLQISQFGGIAFDPKNAYPSGGVETFTYSIIGGTTATATIVIGATGPGLVGTTGADSLTGTATADAMLGRAGDDFLRGGGGGDIMIGGAGADLLEGGAGADLFSFIALGDSRPLALRSDGAKLRPDIILDFEAGLDRIDLRTIDAIAGTAANDAFTFIGAGAFTGQAGQLRAVGAGGGATVLADLDGDGNADLCIAVLTPVPLTATDFIL
ncbi:MAG TPA: M10 family metallopeptidase C-terminal domain-containing protein [Allosphingosinicella sp.]|nr:M10 family metallopeptidase C-terminal domain-containing protein [Allosphingosinicella sp.]